MEVALLTGWVLSAQMSTTPSVANSATPKRLSKMPANHALNVNDLLNFTLPPRQTRPLTSLPRRSRKTGNMQGVWNKERECRFCILSRAVSDSEHGYLGFVNAQYRFVMNPTGDYTVHFADPDM